MARKQGRLFKCFVLACSLASSLLAGQLLHADTISVAVTSNFDFTAEELKRIFEATSDHEILLT